MTADLLMEMLREAAPEERAKVARRLANLADIPPALARMLLRDSLEIAGALLEHSQHLGDADLIDCALYAEMEHRRLIALRDAGVAILLVSVELEEVMALSDRILALCGGQITGEREAMATDERDLGLLMAGVSERAA